MGGTNLEVPPGSAMLVWAPPAPSLAPRRLCPLWVISVTPACPREVRSCPVCEHDRASMRPPVVSWSAHTGGYAPVPPARVPLRGRYGRLGAFPSRTCAGAATRATNPTRRMRAQLQSRAPRFYFREIGLSWVIGRPGRLPIPSVGKSVRKPPACFDRGPRSPIFDSSRG